MKKEYILSEDEKKQKKQKIEENRVRKHQKQMNRKGNVNHNNDDSSASPTSSSLQVSRPCPAFFFAAMFSFLLYLGWSVKDRLGLG